MAELNNVSADQLNELIQRYKSITENLNKSIDDMTKANHELIICKAEVSKNTHSLNLIKEEIMCAKKIIDASR